MTLQFIRDHITSASLLLRYGSEQVTLLLLPRDVLKVITPQVIILHLQALSTIHEEHLVIGTLHHGVGTPRFRRIEEEELSHLPCLC